MAESEHGAVPRVTPAEMPSLSSLLTLAVCVVVVAALYLGRDVLVPITLAVLLTFVLAPLVRLLRWLRLGRVPAVLVAILVALSVLSSIGGVIGTQIAGLAGDLPRYETTIRAKIDTVREMTIGRITTLVDRFEQMRPAPPIAETPQGLQPPPPQPQATPAPGDDGRQPAAPERRRGTGERGEDEEVGSSTFALLQRYASPVLSPLATLGLVLVFATFILLQKEDLRDRFIRLFGSRDLHRTTVALNDAANRLSRYFLMQLALNTVFGLLVTLGLYVIGLPSPVLWGIVAGLCRFVPYVGAWVAALLPMAVAAAVDPGWSMVLWTGALFAVTEPVMGQAVEPVAYGHSTGLSPVSVLIATVFWTWLWGPIGLLLATPLTLCLVVLGRHVDRLEFLDVLLGDRPALTSTETFYQRMLAGDPDEVQDQAETLLKTRALSSYYDEVALRGLALAAGDASRGVLGPQRLARIRDAVREVVEELDEYDDRRPVPTPRKNDGPIADDRADAEPASEPPGRIAPPIERRTGAWRHSVPVLCIAGASALDEAATAMLKQLLAKHGIGAREVASDRLSRVHVATFDPDEVAMVCISLIEPTGNLSRVRYLVRRLRRQLPDAKILVGLWPAGDGPREGESVRATIGADLYAVSLTEAVNACVDAASEHAVPEEAIEERPEGDAPPQQPRDDDAAAAEDQPESAARSAKSLPKRIARAALATPER